MKITRKWLALILAMSLLAGTLAPSVALAVGGRSSGPIEKGDTSDPPVDQAGDPDGPGSGRALQWIDLASLRQILIASMRITTVLPTAASRVTQSPNVGRSVASSSARTRATR